jgi:hypothetical protein
MRFEGFSLGSVRIDGVSYDHDGSGDLDVTDITRLPLSYQSRMYGANADAFALAFRPNQVRLALSLLAYNLGNLWQRLAKQS